MHIPVSVTCPRCASDKKIGTGMESKHHAMKFLVQVPDVPCTPRMLLHAAPAALLQHWDAELDTRTSAAASQGLC